ncbi:FAA hydrolase family protein, partial [Cribrihabitans sp. XS_ASV171]
MKLVTYRHETAGEARLGVLADGMVVDVELLGEVMGEGLPATMLDLIDMGPDALGAISRALTATEGARPAGLAVPQENVRLLAPIPRPRKNIFG